MKISSLIHLFLSIILVTALTACPAPTQTDDNNAPGPGNGSSAPDGTSSTGTGDNSEGVDGEISLVDMGRGVQVWKSQNCALCHRIGDDPGGDSGPNLTGVGDRYSMDELKALITDPKSVNSDAVMPPQEMTDEDLEFLTRYLSLLSSNLVQ